MTSLVPAIERAIQVLYLFRNGEQKEYGVSEIGRLLDLNKSTVHNILHTLAHHHFLVQNESTRRYHLGPALAELGSLVRSQIDIRVVARPYLRRLMEQTSSTILLGTLSGDKITIVDKEEPVSDVRVAASVGMQLPFCAGAFGRAFLAFLPNEQVEDLLTDPGLRAFTLNSITDPAQYRAVLAQVRVRGYAVDDREEYLLDVGAISAPVFQPAPVSVAAQKDRGEVAGVVTLVSFSSRLTPDRIAGYIPLVTATAEEISERLGTPGEE